MKKAGGLFLMVVLIPFGVAGCSFCVGSGCPSSGIDFGTSYNKDSSGNFSIVGKKDTFKVGEPVAAVANLSDNANTKTLTIHVSGGGKTKNTPFTLPSPNANVVAWQMSGGTLQLVGLAAPGKYTISLLHGSTNLAQGTLTEK